MTHEEQLNRLQEQIEVIQDKMYYYTELEKHIPDILQQLRTERMNVRLEMKAFKESFGDE